MSTRVGDVTSLFDNESAFFLAGYDPADLVDIIADMAHDPNRVERVAKTGLDICNRTFSEKTVGDVMTKLL